jgi:predicted ATPase
MAPVPSGAPSNEALAERLAAVQESVIALRSLMDIRFQAVGDATAKQERSDDYNKAQQNEWRKSLNDLSEKMATKADVSQLREIVTTHSQILAAMPNRSDLDQRFSDMSARVSNLEQGGQRTQGGTDQRKESLGTALSVWSIIAIMASAILGGLAGFLFHPKP